MSSKEINIYIDGACSGNPGPGGMGIIIERGDKTAEYSFGEAHTTNNRMELKSAIIALKRIKSKSKINIFSDSKYLIDGITSWVNNWIRNNWKTYNKKDVLNKDLWLELLKLSKKHEINWNWVKGHTGHPQNERCDELAREAIKKLSF